MQKFLGLLDMLDGGGAGRAGERFEGGPLSGLLNAIGIRPMGYFDRMQAPSIAPMRPMPRGAYTPPQATAGRPPMTPEQIMAAVTRGVPPPYRQPPAPPPQAMPTLYDLWLRDEIMRGQNAVSGLGMGMNYPAGAR